jgi:hypothetical protein
MLQLQLTIRDETLKKVQSGVQVQKNWSEKFMSFVDKQTNKVDMHRILQELDKLQ